MTPVPAEPIVQKWTRVHWFAAIAIIFALHVTLIFIFGSHKPIAPAPVKNVPSMAVAGRSADSLPAMNDATLFALPDQNGFSGPMWVNPNIGKFRQQDWTEEPHWLADSSPLAVNELVAAFRHYIQTNHFAKTGFEYDQSPPLTVPVIKEEPILAQESTLQVAGDVANRALLNPVKLPSWPGSDVIAPSVVQVLVDASGNVVSAALLPPLNSLEPSAVRNADADTRAIEIARNARFAPLSSHAGSPGFQPLTHLSVGQLIFNWQAVPAASSNGQ